MSKLLAIESSGSIGSVALFENSQLIDTEVISEERSHSRLLAGQIKELLARNKVGFSSLSGIGVSGGPGSYTGLRIGASLAKGLCFTLDIPLIAIGTLRIIAEAVNTENVDAVCPMIDARRMEVYTTVYDRSMEVLLPQQAMVLDELSFKELLHDKEIVFIGDGAVKAQDIISHPSARFQPEIIALAENMGRLLYNKYSKGIFEYLNRFEPNYLKPFYSPKPKSV